MKKILTALAIIMFPLTSLAYTGSWGGTSTTTPIFYPLSVFGNMPAVWADHFVATSTTASSTFPTLSATNLYTSSIGLGASAISYIRGLFTGGTGISVSGGVITNTAPDQTVAFTNGTGISVTGTYPNFTITNTSPDTNFFTQSGSTTTNKVDNLSSTKGVFGTVEATSTTGTSTFSNWVKITPNSVGLIADQFQAVDSSGIDLKANSGTVIGLFGAGGGANATFYDGLTNYGTFTTNNVQATGTTASKFVNASSSNLTISTSTYLTYLSNTVLAVDGSGKVIATTTGGGGSQTPWTSNIDGGGYNLTNVNKIAVNNGSYSTPSITFSSDSSTGIYNDGFGDIAISVGGSGLYTFGDSFTGAIFDGPTISNTYGGAWTLNRSNSVSSPPYTFNANTNTGFYHPSTNTIGVSTNGSEIARFTTTGLGIGTTTPVSALAIVGTTTTTGLNTPLYTPASSSATCTTGDWAHDASYIYTCTATNTWKRVSLSTF